MNSTRERGRGSQPGGRARGRGGRQGRQSQSQVVPDAEPHSDAESAKFLADANSQSDGDHHNIDSESDINMEETAAAVEPEEPASQALSAINRNRADTAASSSSSRPPRSSTHHQSVERGERGPPSSVFNPSTIWVGNIAVVRRDDTPVPFLQTATYR